MALLNPGIGSGGSTPVPSNFVQGQAAVGTAAAQIDASSVALSNGVIVQAMSTNTASIFVGITGVTVANGFELQPGQATSIAVNNINVIYAISGSASQAVCFIGS